MLISKNKLSYILRPDTVAVLKKDEYNISYVCPIDLLTFDRFDIIAKYIYVKFHILKIDSGFARDLYLKHIECFNGFYENDGSNKLGGDAFIKDFDDVILSIGDNGFYDKGIIPLNINRSIMDGAHRLAASLYFDCVIPVVSVEGDELVYDYKYFKNRGLDANYLDYMALEYLKLKDNMYVITLWPSSGGGMEEELSEIFSRYGDVVYRKEVFLEKDGCVQLVKSAYQGESWLGCDKDNFLGARNKARWCFSKKGPVRAILFESKLDMIKMKDEIRSLFQIEKHAVHINDTKEEACVLAGLLFNENSIHWMNHSVIREFSWFERLFLHYKRWIDQKEYPKDEFCVDGSSTLAMYGVREVRDLDYVHFSEDLEDTGFKEISSHNSELQYHPIGKDQIIFDPNFHFIVDGYKFVSLAVIKTMKEVRGEKKDDDDLELINKIVLHRLLSVSIKDRLKCMSNLSFWKSRIKFYLLKIRYYLLLLKRKSLNK